MCDGSSAANHYQLKYKKNNNNSTQYDDIMKSTSNHNEKPGENTTDVQIIQFCIVTCKLVQLLLIIESLLINRKVFYRYIQYILEIIYFILLKNV
jgi:hypothetical protein